MALGVHLCRCLLVSQLLTRCVNLLCPFRPFFVDAADIGQRAGLSRRPIPMSVHGEQLVNDPRLPVIQSHTAHAGELDHLRAESPDRLR